MAKLKTPASTFLSFYPLPFPQIIGVDRVHAIEHSEIDPEARELRIRSRNVSYSNLITIEESIVYRQHPDDPNK